MLARKGNGRRRKEKTGGNHDVLGVILFIVALFLFLCAAIPPFLSVFSQAIHAVLLGVFGILTYPMLVGVLFWGVCLVMHRSPELSVRKTVCIVLLVVFVSIILQLATTHNYLNEKFSDYISDVYSAKFTMGGVIFGTVAFGLKSAITEIGCYVVFSVAVLVTVAVMIDLVRIVRDFKAKRAQNPKTEEQRPKRPGFRDEAEPQGVIASNNRGRLTLIDLAPAIVTDTGVSSALDGGEKRNVTDFSSEPVIEESDEDDEELRERERNVHELYADVDTITKKETEEFKRRVEGPPKPEKPTFEPQFGMPVDIPPYARVEHDASVAQASAPKRYDHDASSVTQLAFPVNKDIQFNRDGIENIESIGDYLRENSERRKRSEIDGRSSGAVEQRPASPGFSSHGYDRIKPPLDVFDTDPNREDIVQATPDEDLAALGAHTPVTPASPLRNDAPPTFGISPSSRDDALMASLGRSNSRDDDIINIQQIQSDAQSVQIPVEGEIVDASAVAEMMGRSPEQPPRGGDADIGRSARDGAARPISPIIDANAPAARQEPAVTPDSDNGIVNIDSGAVRPESTLVISSEPAVDMSEGHDINGDLIEGRDLSGMYTPIDEKPAPSGPRQKKIAPIKDQISMDNVIQQTATESVVMTEGHRRMKYNYVPPPIDLLRVNDKAEVPMEAIKETAATLETIVSGYLKADVKVINIVPGPTVTRYEIELPSGVPVKQIEARSSDIEYELATISKIRIEAPIPGKRAVGIEVPNREKAIVGLRDIIESHEFTHSKSPMTISVGKDIAGAVVLCDLEKIPHLLIAGQTGSGKSACLNGLIISLLYKASPEDLRFILVDPKRVEFSKYRSMPHLLFDNIVYEYDDTLSALKWAANEMERRYMLMSKYGCSQLSAYNSLPDVVNGNFDKLPHIIVVIDELADIMSSPLKRDIEDRIKVIAAKARAAGIHLIVATQRPSADVITGTIKTNLTSRIAFKVSTQLDSRIIFDTQGAEALVGNGDMLFYPVTYSAPRRVQGSYITDEEVSSVITYIKENYASDFDEDAAKAVFGGGGNGDGSGEGGGGEKDDVLMPDVLAFVIKAGNASTSSIQRRFSIGYARAARIIDNMEAQGYIGKNTGSSKPRDVFITADKYREIYNRDVEEN